MAFSGCTISSPVNIPSNSQCAVSTGSREITITPATSNTVAIVTGAVITIKNIAGTNLDSVSNAGAFTVKTYNTISGTDYLVDQSGSDASFTNPITFTQATMPGPFSIALNPTTGKTG